MPRILTEDTQTALWHHLVNEAQQRAGHQLDETLESYLVFVLMRHLKDQGLGQEALALEYLKAHADTGTRGRQRLRDTGDHCLLLAGLFPERARRRRVPVTYYIDLGRGAYRDLGDLLRAGIAELYAELAEGFENLVEVLLAARGIESFDDRLMARVTDFPSSGQRRH
jgi:hypothetical protein